MLRQGVIVRPLRAFGLPRCVRVTVGTQAENAAAVAALGAMLRDPDGVTPGAIEDASTPRTAIID